jgi:uncharacterized protein YjbI with pentapeptide repeats
VKTSHNSSGQRAGGGSGAGGKLLRIVLLFAVMLLGAGGGLAWAQGKGEAPLPPGLARLTGTEQWVLQQVGAGRVADLKERFGEDEGAHTIRGEFVQTLLTDGFPGFKAHRSGIYLVNAIIPDILSLQFAEVDHAVFLVGCQFRGLVTCSGSHFKKTLGMKGAVFAKQADFHQLKVDLDAFLGEAVFEGPVDFGAARIEGNLVLKGASFTGKDREANFNGLKLGGSLHCTNAVFEGGVDLTGASIGAEFNAQGARFASPDKKVSFTGVKVGQIASFDRAEFRGPVSLADTQVSGTFSAVGARFESSGQEILFTSLKVGSGALFNGTVFKGPVNFSNADIAGGLHFDEARFENREHPIKFYGLKADNIASFMETVFQGGVSMIMASFKNLMFSGSPDSSLTYPLLNLDGAVVDYSLIIADLNLQTLQAGRLQVKGPTILKKVKVSRKADLRDSSFYSLKMLDVAWPANPADVWLEGLTYQSVSAGEGPQDWQKLLAWVNQSRFDSRNYQQLEDFFLHGGTKDRADTVYIEGKRREVMQKWWHPYNLATLIFWDGLAGYGKKPARTLWVSLLIVFIGTFVFDYRNFDPNFIGGWSWLLKGNRAKTMVVQFFLSLDEFLPGVDLGLARLWHIEKISFPTLLYYHFHKISGWVLIPIGLAAVFSQFK